MSTGAKVATAELALYVLAMWASYEMSKTPDQRVRDRLRRYLFTARACGWLAFQLGQLGIRAELAYHREIDIP
jgi:hypothetical protein